MTMTPETRALALRVIEATKTHPDAGCEEGQQEWLIDECGIDCELVRAAYGPNVPDFVEVTLSIRVDPDAFVSGDNGRTLLEAIEGALDTSDCVEGYGSFITAARVITEDEHRRANIGRRLSLLD